MCCPKGVALKRENRRENRKVKSDYGFVLCSVAPILYGVALKFCAVALLDHFLTSCGFSHDGKRL